MNLLRILEEARRRLGLAGKPAVAEPVIADPDLADRIRHGLKRPMNRRELFRFTAIAAAVGTPAVRELILSPAKTIVVPPAEMFRVPLQMYAGGQYGTFSTAETVAAQREKVGDKLPVVFDHSRILESLLRGVEPHLQTMYDSGRDPMLAAVLPATAREILLANPPGDVRIAFDPPRLAYPELIGDDELDDYDDWDDWPDEVEEA